MWMNSLLQVVYIMQASLIPYIQLWSSTLGTPCKDIEEHHGHLGSRKEQCFLTHARATTTAFSTDDQCQASEVHWAKWFRLLLHFFVLLHIAPEKEWNFVWLDVRNQWGIELKVWFVNLVSVVVAVVVAELCVFMNADLLVRLIECYLYKAILLK